MRRLLAAIGIAVGLGLVGWAFFGRQSDEDLIRARLEQFENAIRVDGQENIVFRATRLDREFGEILDEDVAVQIPELTSLTRGRKGLAQVAVRASGYYQAATVSFEDLDISLEPEAALALVRATAKLDAVQGGTPQVDERSVLMRFAKVDGEWKISAIDVGGKR